MFEQINMYTTYTLAIYIYIHTCTYQNIAQVANKELSTTDRYEKPKQTDICSRVENIWDIVCFTCIVYDGAVCE